MEQQNNQPKVTGITALFQYLQGDRTVWVVSIVLSLFSILVVYSATSNLAYRTEGGDTEYFLFKHGVLVILSLIAMYVCHKVDYVYYSKLSRYALLFSVPLLFLTWQFGATLNEASRWVVIPIINYTFQPADLAKLALITNVASMLSKRQLSIEEFQKAVVPVIGWVAVVCALIGVTNWSNASLLFITCMLLMFIGRVPVRYLGMMVMAGVFAGIFAFTVGQRGQTVSSRLGAYLSDEEIPYQAEQSYIAVATGGFTGLGAGKSIQRNFLPHPYSDFVFAIVIEEYGFLGAAVVVGLYLLLLYRGMLIVAGSDRPFGGLLAAGLVFSLVLQAFVHMGVVVGLLPVTGLTLPLLSMGGTSLLFTGIGLGIILSVSRTGTETDATDFFKSKGGKRNRVRRDMAANVPRI